MSYSMDILKNQYKSYLMQNLDQQTIQDYLDCEADAEAEFYDVLIDDRIDPDKLFDAAVIAAANRGQTLEDLVRDMGRDREAMDRLRRQDTLFSAEKEYQEGYAR